MVLSIFFGSLLLGLCIYVFDCELTIGGPMPFNNYNFCFISRKRKQNQEEEENHVAKAKKKMKKAKKEPGKN